MGIIINTSSVMRYSKPTHAYSANKINLVIYQMRFVRWLKANNIIVASFAQNDTSIYIISTFQAHHFFFQRTSCVCNFKPPTTDRRINVHKIISKIDVYKVSNLKHVCIVICSYKCQT